MVLQLSTKQPTERLCGFESLTFRYSNLIPVTTMILLLGDIHGDTNVLKKAVHTANDVGAEALIQVGDFGMFKKSEPAFREAIKYNSVPIYFIEGNHDDCQRWIQLREVTRIWEDRNLFYVPRGTVMEIDGRMIAFMGGAASIDKATRLHEGWHWDQYENIDPSEVLRLFENAKDKTIDVLITHDTPTSVTKAHFDDSAKLWFGVGKDWHDHNMDVIQTIWDKLGNPQIYCGHMHRSVIGPNYRILNIDELLAI
jgi:Icc-related predicted phosphoesterase